MPTNAEAARCVLRQSALAREGAQPEK